MSCRVPRKGRAEFGHSSRSELPSTSTSADPAAVLAITDVAKSFATGDARRRVFAGVNLDLRATDYVAVMGESGVGKSTLLNLVAGLDEADGASIVLDGHCMNGYRVFW